MTSNHLEWTWNKLKTHPIMKIDYLFIYWRKTFHAPTRNLAISTMLAVLASPSSKKYFNIRLDRAAGWFLRRLISINLLWALFQAAIIAACWSAVGFHPHWDIWPWTNSFHAAHSPASRIPLLSPSKPARMTRASTAAKPARVYLNFKLELRSI